MTRITKYCCLVIVLLAALSFSPAVSNAQKTTEPGSIDPYSVLPVSDALVVVDTKRYISEVVPRLLVGEQETRPVVMALFDSKTIDLLDPRAMQRLIVGLRYKKDAKSTSDFEMLLVAQSSEASQLASVIRTRGSGKYREQQYAGKTLYITKEQGEASSEEDAWAVVALDANTLVFGNPTYVRSSLDVHSGKGTTVNAELVTALKKDSKALVSAAGLLPPSLMVGGEELANSELGQILSSLKRVYASIELVPPGLDVAVTMTTASPEQAKRLADLLTAVKTLTSSLAPGQTRQDKVIRDLIKGVLISAEGTDVQIKDEITQANVNELAKHVAAGVYFSLGLAMEQMGDPDAAIANYNKSILLEPDNANTFINRGKARANKGALDEAIADYDKAISMDPESALAYNNRCFTRLKKGDFQAAVADCDKSIELDPTFPFSYNNRGQALASLGKLEKAMPDFDKSIALDEENFFAYQNRGDARIRIGNWDGAIADFDKAISIDAKSADAYNSRGLARYYRGDLDQAIADYDKAIAIEPDLAEAYGNRAVSLLALRKDAQAEQDLKKCFALNESLRPVFEPFVKEIKKTRKTKP